MSSGFGSDPACNVCPQGDEKRIPTLIVWSLGGAEVSVEGSWDNWTISEQLQQVGKDFTIIKVLRCGVYQFKFLVDGEWRYATDLPVVFDEMGNANNVIDVQEHVPENLEGIAAFDLPRSPSSSYGDETMIAPGDFAKEPPLLPPQLQFTLLNTETKQSVPRPPHVILNHTYIDHRENSVTSVMSLGLTHRFRSKFVTLILYKPAVTSKI